MIASIFDGITVFADTFAEIAHSFGVLGVFFFLLIVIAVVLFFIPITPFSIAAGAIYGWWGIPIVYSGAVIGSMIAFWFARGIGSEYVKKLCEKRPIAKAIERTIAVGGFRLVLLIRLSGVLPFAVQNYTFGLTTVNWRSYLSASLIGLVPGALIKVWIGKAGMEALHSDSNPGFWFDRLTMLSILIAVVMTILMLVYVGGLAVRELRAVGIFDPQEDAP